MSYVIYPSQTPCSVSILLAWDVLTCLGAIALFPYPKKIEPPPRLKFDRIQCLTIYH